MSIGQWPWVTGDDINETSANLNKGVHLSNSDKSCYISSNADYNITTGVWTRVDTDNSACAIRLDPSGNISFLYAAAGANPLTWTTRSIFNGANDRLEVDAVSELTPDHGIILDGSEIKDGNLTLSGRMNAAQVKVDEIRSLARVQINPAEDIWTDMKIIPLSPFTGLVAGDYLEVQIEWEIPYYSSSGRSLRITDGTTVRSVVEYSYYGGSNYMSMKYWHKSILVTGFTAAGALHIQGMNGVAGRVIAILNVRIKQIIT